MQNTRNGFSFAEVMISMVILSIVVLFISTTITTSSRMTRKTLGTDDARAIAKERLTSLQDEGNVSRSNTTGVTIPRNGTDYDVTWTVGTTAPYKCSVNVEWTLDNNQKEISLVGYIHGNVCPDLSGSNHAPSSFQLSAPNGSVISGNSHEIPLNVGQHRVIR
jgi:prepilin-type N-terminal cleavage/methylation domain-containing protein